MQKRRKTHRQRSGHDVSSAKSFFSADHNSETQKFNFWVKKKGKYLYRYSVDAMKNAARNSEYGFLQELTLIRVFRFLVSFSIAFKDEREIETGQGQRTAL